MMLYLFRYFNALTCRSSMGCVNSFNARGTTLLMAGSQSSTAGVYVHYLDFICNYIKFFRVFSLGKALSEPFWKLYLLSKFA